MDKNDVIYLKKLIENANVISFDIFDTLLLRKVNTPESIFEIVGNNFSIANFQRMRVEAQQKVSKLLHDLYSYPHANMDEIYDELKKYKLDNIDWDVVKNFEYQVEKDALVQNVEMFSIYEYAKNLKKRIIITSDMYLPACFLKEVLNSAGYYGFNEMYISSNERKAKFDSTLFYRLLKNENIISKSILHIGDNFMSDYQMPRKLGIVAYHYERNINLSKIVDCNDSLIDKGIYNILAKNNEFWYNLGLEVGGPMYCGLYFWLENNLKKIDANKTIYFISRDGFNLWEIYKKINNRKVKYVYTSRRALLLAGIADLSNENLDLLPPFTFGQTVGEILDYLSIDREKLRNLKECGFEGFDDLIETTDDINNFKKLYLYNREVVLDVCLYERNNAKLYFKSIGLLDDTSEAIFFDCGWNGSTQYLLEKFFCSIGKKIHTKFYYAGIFNTDKSRKQLRGYRYEAFLFDMSRNKYMQDIVRESTAICELFFSAPYPSLFKYGNGRLVFEEESVSIFKHHIRNGIMDFFFAANEFVSKYKLFFSPELSLAHYKRLVKNPTCEEAVNIGNISDVDGFVRKIGAKKYLAYITDEMLEANPNVELYWIRGLLARPDVSDNVKRYIRKRYSIMDDKKRKSIYNFEDIYMVKIYEHWRLSKKKERIVYHDLVYEPFFSVVIPVYNTITTQLRECIESVLSQTYTKYELILVDDNSSWQNVRLLLQEYENYENVKIVYRKENGHISVATNDGIAIAHGDFIVFMDCDDFIEKDALYFFAAKLNENSGYDFIYSDEDKVTEDGKIFHMPFFKPDWSPDLLMSMMYTNHLAAYRTELVKRIGGLRSEYNGAQDYDFTLRFMELSENKKVGHIPRILYHWRERVESIAYSMNSKDYAVTAAKNAKVDALHRRHINGRLEKVSDMPQHRVVYDVEGCPLVSIIIPSKDNFDILKVCINSIKIHTDYDNYEIVVVDNGSNEIQKIHIENFLQMNNCRYLCREMEFNFSKMCNIGAQHARGKYLLFMNDDVEILQSDWMHRILGQAQQKHTGAVGIKLLFPETTLIQHDGITNLNDGPNHVFFRLDDSLVRYFGFNRVDCNYLAVTAACMMVDCSKFKEVGGFDESLPVAYNDVDLCFCLYKAGYYNVVRNDVIAYHHESYSRGRDELSDAKKLRLGREKQFLYKKHISLQGWDPFYNENFGCNINYLLGMPSKLRIINLYWKCERRYYKILNLVTKGYYMLKLKGATYTLRKIRDKLKFIRL